MNNETEFTTDLRQPKWLKIIQQLGPVLALGVVILIFAVLDTLQEDGGTFLSLRNAQVILSSTAVVAVAALGMTMIIISANFTTKIFEIFAEVGEEGVANLVTNRTGTRLNRSSRAKG